MEKEKEFMRRALELAGMGLGGASPNPLVGCVIVHEDKIIGEGWHKKFGGPHAEVHAIEQVADHALLSESTVYVNLEPCSHFGKTPPCADLLVKKQVKRVVIANRDPNPRVAGSGIDRLRAAGVEVVQGVLEKEGRWLNRRFFTNMEQRLPYVILKWAESADGFMAAANRQPVWISNERSRQRVHQWRSEEDAVLVGAGTAAADNPRLNVRDWSGRNPVRVVLDPSLRLSSGLHLFDGSQQTLCYNHKRQEHRDGLSFVQVHQQDFLRGVLTDLLERNVGSVMVEGGPFTLQRFIESDLWHEARIIRSSKSLKEGVESPRLEQEPVQTDSITGDELAVCLNQSVKLDD